MRAALRVVLAPASWVLNRLTVAPKLALIGAVLIVPTVFVTWQYVHLKDEQIDFSAKELLGVAYLEQTNELLAALTTMRLAAVADESPERAADVAAAQQAVSRAVADVDGVDERLGAQLAVGDAWAKARRQIGALPTEGGDAEGTYATYSKALDALLALNVAVGDASNLILDPDLDSFYLMDAVVNQLPVAMTTAGGTAALQRVFTENGQTPDQADFVTLAMNHGEMDSALAKVNDGFPRRSRTPRTQPSSPPSRRSSPPSTRPSAQSTRSPRRRSRATSARGRRRSGPQMSWPRRRRSRTRRRPSSRSSSRHASTA